MTLNKGENGDIYDGRDNIYKEKKSEVKNVSC